MLRAFLSLLVAGVASTAWSAVPAPRTVDVTTPDGVILKATYYAVAQPGPAVLLLNMTKGGLVDKALKKLYGARLTFPDPSNVEIQPMGRGTTSARNGSWGRP